MTLIDKAKALASVDAISRKAVMDLIVDGECYTVDELMAAIAAMPAAVPGVKPLVWREQYGYAARAIAIVGIYAIEYFPGQSQPYRLNGLCGERSWHSTLDAAKAAAQADYEARILAALEPALAPTEAPHVNETPKSEHDAGIVLMDAAQAREAALREAADLFQLHPWTWNAKEIRAKILALIEEART